MTFSDVIKKIIVYGSPVLLPAWGYFLHWFFKKLDEKLDKNWWERYRRGLQRKKERRLRKRRRKAYWRLVRYRLASRRKVGG